MAENKYQELDDAICAHIGQRIAQPTASSALEAIARPLLARNKTPFPEAWRLIDRRMQAMRKAGRIVYERTKGSVRGRWSVADTEIHGNNEHDQ
jgi:hypothetical protein